MRDDDYIDNDDDDNDDDDDELHMRDDRQTKGLTMSVSRIWTCAKPEFRLLCTKLCSSVNQYTSAHFFLMVLIFLDMGFTSSTKNTGTLMIYDLRFFSRPVATGITQ